METKFRLKAYTWRRSVAVRPGVEKLGTLCIIIQLYRMYFHNLQTEWDPEKRPLKVYTVKIVNDFPVPSGRE